MQIHLPFLTPVLCPCPIQQDGLVVRSLDEFDNGCIPIHGGMRVSDVVADFINHGQVLERYLNCIKSWGRKIQLPIIKGAVPVPPLWIILSVRCIPMCRFIVICLSCKNYNSIFIIFFPLCYQIWWIKMYISDSWRTIVWTPFHTYKVYARPYIDIWRSILLRDFFMCGIVLS